MRELRKDRGDHEFTNSSNVTVYDGRLLHMQVAKTSEDVSYLENVSDILLGRLKAYAVKSTIPRIRLEIRS